MGSGMYFITNTMAATAAIAIAAFEFLIQSLSRRTCLQKHDLSGPHASTTVCQGLSTPLSRSMFSVRTYQKKWTLIFLIFFFASKDFGACVEDLLELCRPPWPHKLPWAETNSFAANRLDDRLHAHEIQASRLHATVEFQCLLKTKFAQTFLSKTLEFETLCLRVRSWMRCLRMVH